MKTLRDYFTEEDWALIISSDASSNAAARYAGGAMPLEQALAIIETDLGVTPINQVPLVHTSSADADGEEGITSAMLLDAAKTIGLCTAVGAVGGQVLRERTVAQGAVVGAIAGVGISVAKFLMREW